MTTEQFEQAKPCPFCGEAAEEILEDIAQTILDKYPHSSEYPSFIHDNSATAAMIEFATLRAQKIADKMVSERLREELIKFLEDEQVQFTYGVVPNESIVDKYLKNVKK